MTVSELLRSQSRWGRTRTRKFLMPLAVNENRQLGRLTLRQKEALAGALADKLAARRCPSPAHSTARGLAGRSTRPLVNPDRMLRLRRPLRSGPAIAWKQDRR
jgi:hypothetical protein